MLIFISYRILVRLMTRASSIHMDKNILFDDAKAIMQKISLDVFNKILCEFRIF